MESGFRNPLPGVPDVESPFFHQLFSDRTGEVKRIASDLHENGFAIFEFPQPDIERMSTAIIESLSPMVDLEGFRASRTNNLRIQDAWKAVPEVRQIACNSSVIDLLTALYGRRAFPFQTLNFAAGSQQHPHTDSVHFSSIPERYMCGVWLALEDISDDAGPLIYYPGSHKLPIYVNEHIGQFLSQNMNSADQTWYEDMWRELVRVHDLKEARFTPRRGQALIWAANLLHGGARHENRSRTRWSQVTHYYFEDCSYYTPMWSDPGFGRTYYRRPVNLLTGEFQPHTYLSAPVPWQVTGPWGECPMPGKTRQVLHLTMPGVVHRLQPAVRKALSLLRRPARA